MLLYIVSGRPQGDNCPPPYILDDLPKDDQKLIDTCGEEILEMMEGMGGVLMIEDDVVIETSIAEHYADFDFMIAVFRGT